MRDHAAPGAPKIAVVGLVGGRPVDDRAARSLARASLVVGGEPALSELAAGRPTASLRNGLSPALDRIAHTRASSAAPIAVLASGDPGFFGIVRALAERFGPGALDVHPAPSSVSRAFARLGLPWDDAVVASAHGRDPEPALGAVVDAPKAAVLTGPACPPEAVGARLRELDAGLRRVVVASRLDEPEESITTTDLDGLASGTWDHRSVVVLLENAPAAGVVEPGPTGAHRAPAVAAAPATAWPPAPLDARAGMITKPEVRATVVWHLALPETGVLWDLGAGSGSVAIAAAAARPGLRVVAVERRADDAARIRANAARHGVAVEVAEGDALEVIASLPDPDRVFVGGGGLDVLDAALARARPAAPGSGGDDRRIVATFAALDRALGALDRLGNLVQIAVSHAARLPDGGVRLAPDNPVFVAWGPGTGPTTRPTAEADR